MVIAGLLELPVDNVLEMRFVALHGGGAKVGGIPVSGLMVLEPVADLTATGGSPETCAASYGVWPAMDTLPGVQKPSASTVLGVGAGAGVT